MIAGQPQASPPPKYVYSATLQKALEARSTAGTAKSWRDASVHGIKEVNDRVVLRGTIPIPSPTATDKKAVVHQPLPTPAAAVAIPVSAAPAPATASPGEEEPPQAAPYTAQFPETEYCAANVDTLSAALALLKLETAAPKGEKETAAPKGEKETAAPVSMPPETESSAPVGVSDSSGGGGPERPQQRPVDPQHTRVAVLSFANADTPGGRYVSGGRAQEEDLCRLLPQLYHTLMMAAGGDGSDAGGEGGRGRTCSAAPRGRGSGKPQQGAYPIPPGTTLVSRDLLAVRRPGTYEFCPSQGAVTVLTAAMPAGLGEARPAGGFLNPESLWHRTVTLRIRSVLHAAAITGHTDLVLGAFGCGAFGNPVRPVAAVFQEQLGSPAFRGVFRRVVFAIIDPVGTGNLKPFAEEVRKLK